MAGFVLGDVRRGGLFALIAAVLFGASTPAAKAIIAGVHPLMLAGLLYLGSGVGLTMIKLVRRRHGVRVARRDLPWLIGTVLFGGVLGPALLMIGLTSTSGSTASLLLTLEGVFTALLAWIVFREPFNRRIGIGMASIFAGAVLLAANGPSGQAGLFGAFAIGGACLCWAIDNNFTSKISHVEAPTLAAIKGGAAGIVNVGLAIIAGAHVPPFAIVGIAALIGLLGYGVSLILFVLALREIGAARSGAYFSTAPFIGAFVGLLVLREPWSAALGVAGALMAFGVWLHLTEQPQAAIGPEPTLPAAQPHR
ncbi:MAG: DMT family transporter [Pseudomonadota bacterium]|nr:DMT family transporter [Pseudomonadota bacterium]